MPAIIPPDLASPRFKANPFPFYARLRDEAPVFRVVLPDRQVAWLVTRYDDVRALLANPRLAKDRLNALPPDGRPRGPWIPPMFRPLNRNMLDLDPPGHTRLRALVSKAFVPRMVERLGERIQRLCDELLDRAEAAAGSSSCGSTRCRSRPRSSPSSSGFRRRTRRASTAGPGASSR